MRVCIIDELITVKLKQIVYELYTNANGVQNSIRLVYQYQNSKCKR